MKKKVLVVIFVITLIIIAVGFTYAFFTANITGNESSSTLSVSGGVLSLTVDGGNSINVQNIIPSNEEAATKTITLTSTNTTDLAIPYTLSLVVVSNTFSDNVISFSLDSTNTDNNGEIVKSINEQNIAHGSSIISLGSGYFNRGNNQVHTYTLKLYFKETGTNQNIEQGNEIQAYMSIDSKEARLPEELLQMNVIYEPNEDLTYTKNKSIKVSASNDLNNIDESSLRYLWSPISNITDSSLIINAFTNGSNITTPVLTGEYYLYTLVRDQNDNEEIHRSDIYRIDNQAPIITLNGNATINIITGDLYTELGSSASDIQDGDLTSQINTSGSVNTSSPGTYTITYSVSDLSGNSASLIRSVIVTEPTFVNTILGANNINVGSPLTVPGRVISTSEEAVLASTYDEYGTSYYFRGAVENNYVIFANMCWRIVRITGSGDIKIVLFNYNPNTVANPCHTSQDGTTNAYARYSGSTYSTAFNLNSSDNRYIGFKYGSYNSPYSEAHMNTNKSTILTNLETWYISKLSTYVSYLADTIWCNDKSLSSGGGFALGTSYYGAWGRLNNLASASPSLICPSDANGGKLSKFTMTDTSIGNGNLTYKIGLLTADEIAFAGGANAIGNTSYYLYKNDNNWSFALSPFSFTGTSAVVFGISNGGTLGGSSTNVTGGLRPSIALVSGTKVIGNGTTSDPYIVQ